ncbi:hypothetical protein QJS10_CPB15g01218 [Acorus calamus]|uniref:Uncharacterized protein n=1 Tax=Acorus calamus TaxID=4465 RepID=A0AAV9D7G3_ACOCL|nr:hypothetical protein QJS10_CPB15g01218 [Acorus calamus]
MNTPAAVAVMHVLHYKRNFLTVHGVDDLFLLSLGTGHDGGGRRNCLGPSMVEIAFNQMVATGSSSPLVKFHTNFGSKSLTTMPQPSSSSRSSTTKAILEFLWWLCSSSKEGSY